MEVMEYGTYIAWIQKLSEKSFLILALSSSSSLLTARGASCPPERAMSTWTTIRSVKIYNKQLE